MAKLSRSEALERDDAAFARSVRPQKRSGPGLILGMPLGDLGWFTSLLMGVASGFLAFFAATFCGIVSILALNTFGRRSIDFSLSYRRIGLPIGLTVGVIALLYLGSLWTRRQLRRS